MLDDPAFLGKVVFAGKYDPAHFFDLKYSNQAIRALRLLDKGEMDAVILNGQQYAALDSLKLSTPLEAIFTSEEIPLMGMVANSKSSTADERTHFSTAISQLYADAEGKKLCELFGVDSFAAVDPAKLEPIAALWNQGK